MKVMKNGDVATNFEETYGFDVESISIKKGHKLTIYQGNINEIDIHSKMYLEYEVTVRRKILLIFFKYIILGNSLNGKSKKFVADANDVHVSDEELKSFDDNVNSAKCVGINTTPGKNTNL